MTTSMTITCPNCQHKFQAEEALKHHMSQELAERTRELESNYKTRQSELEQLMTQLDKKEQSIDQLVKERLAKSRGVLKEEMRKELTGDFEGAINAYKEKVAQQQSKLKELTEKDLQIEELKDQLHNVNQDLELKYKRQFREKEQHLEQQLRESLMSDVQMKMREKDKTMEDYRNQIDQLKRKLEQGSMQLQGEVQELMIEERLKELFPQDEITEINKGVRGADVTQTVLNNSVLCGTLLYESKNTQKFSNDWIDKLRSDQMASGAHTAILVTRTMPKGQEGEYYTEKGIIVCSIRLFPVVAALCRHKLVDLKHQANRFDLQKDTSGLLYQYLTGEEFRLHLEELVGGLMNLKTQISKERAAFEKQWKQRDKEVDRMYANLAQMFGSIKGIGGASIKEIKSLELFN